MLRVITSGVLVHSKTQSSETQHYTIQNRCMVLGNASNRWFDIVGKTCFRVIVANWTVTINQYNFSF